MIQQKNDEAFDTLEECGLTKVDCVTPKAKLLATMPFFEDNE